MTRVEDAPYLEVLRAVQQLHGDTLAKLTAASSQHSETLAVHANILTTLASTQSNHAHDIDLATVALAEIRSSVKVIMWVVSVFIPLLTLAINVGLYLLSKQ